MKLKIFHDDESKLTWAVRIVETGDVYGLHNKLVSAGTLVEFYDCRCEEDTDFGQFVSSYYLRTLLNGKSSRECGLNLDGGVPDWSINLKCYTRILDWLEAQNGQL